MLGVYFFCDEYGEVFYVGKVMLLRKWVVNYFVVDLFVKMRVMIVVVVSLEWIVILSNVVVIMLEYLFV